MSDEPSLSSILIEVTDADGNVSTITAAKVMDVCMAVNDPTDYTGLLLGELLPKPTAYDLTVTFRVLKGDNGEFYRLTKPSTALWRLGGTP